MTKLVVKCGDIEVEYDGPEEFLKQELPELIKAIAQLRATPAAKGGTAAAANFSSSPAGGGETSVSTIAQQLSVNNGPDLIVAAALSLARAGAESFTKKQLRERTREATTFYRSSYTNNFDNYVGRLVKKGRLNHMGGENYALPSKERTGLEGQLGSAA